MKVAFALILTRSCCRPVPLRRINLTRSWMTFTGMIIAYVIESLFPDIARHCALCYPVNIVQCKGQGRVMVSTLVLKPISGTSVVYSLNRLQSRLQDANVEINKLHRQMAMLLENHKAIARCLLVSTPELIAHLHPDTPDTWFEGLTEEF